MNLGVCRNICEDIRIRSGRIYREYCVDVKIIYIIMLQCENILKETEAGGSLCSRSAWSA